MANTEIERRGSGRQLTLVWAGLAVVLIVVFLVWLGISSEPSEMALVREAREADATTVSPDAPVPVTIEEFARNVDAQVGRAVRLDDVAIAARMGTRAFWINLPGDVPFLVQLTPELVQDGQQVQAGQVVSVAGIVHVRTDSVLAAWEEQGVIATAGQRAEAEFASHFIEASRITPTR